MNCTVSSYPVVTVPFLFQNPKPLETLNFNRRWPNARPLIALHKTLHYVCRRRFIVKSSLENDAESGDWVSRLPGGAFGADKVFRLISGATASPICQFISSPTTFLHSVDPRVKLVIQSLYLFFLQIMTQFLHLLFYGLIKYFPVWLVTLVVLPARSHIVMRFGLVAYLALLSMWILPTNMWMDQLGRVSFLSGILFIMLGLGADGVPPLVQPRTPPSAMMGLPNIPPSLMGYSYLIVKLGPLQFTRKGLSVASTAACLTFTIFQSVNLCLATTAPEQLAFALQWFMLPLTSLSVPVAEMILTLLLSLRFINLVFDEVRNVALGIVSRRINWKQLTMMETVDVFSTYIRRVFKNIFNHAEQISQAMIVRGFKGDSATHKIFLLSDLHFGIPDIISLVCLCGLIAAGVLSECYLG